MPAGRLSTRRRRRLTTTPLWRRWVTTSAICFDELRSGGSGVRVPSSASTAESQVPVPRHRRSPPPASCQRRPAYARPDLLLGLASQRSELREQVRVVPQRERG